MNHELQHHHDHLLTEAEAAKRLKLSQRTMQRMRAQAGGPAYTRIGLRRVFYSEAALNAYAAGRSYKHRADELASAA